MAEKNNQNNPNKEEVQGSAVVAAPIDGGGDAAAQSGDNGGGVQPLIPVDVPEGGSQAANHWQAGVSASQSASQQEHGSQSQQTTKHVYAPAMTKEQVEEEYRRSPSAVSQIMPWIQDDLDPDKIAQRKKDANFRKGLHEAVESLRVLSDIGASFAGGQAYKRNAPDYKRYEDEKAKIDQARQNALGKLFEAMGKDRDYKRQLDALVLGKSLASVTNTDSNGWQNGSQQQQGQQYQEGYQSNVHHSYTHSDGGSKTKDEQTVVNMPFTMSNQDGVTKFHPGNSTVKFDTNAKRVDFMNELASVTKKEEGKYQLRTTSARNAWSAIYDGLADSNMFNGVTFYDKYKMPTEEGKQIMSLIMGSGENTVSDSYGDDSANKFMWNGKDLTGLRESLLMKYTLKTKGGQEKFNTYKNAGWLQYTTDKANVGNPSGGQQAAAGGEEEGAFNGLGTKKQ